MFCKALCSRLPHRTDLGLLLLRVALGAVFITHGWMKLADLPGTVGFFGMIGLPAALAYAVAFIEFVGGICVLVGACARGAAYLLAAVMIGAIATLKFKAGFVGGWEFEGTLLLAALAIALAGPGRHAVDGKFCEAKKA